MKGNNVKCVICNITMVSMGKYFEDEYADCRDKYICLGCKAARDITSKQS
jgi:hypothetical protein